jgi:predicted DCC family thiol-disulfide oxidoreductase YuxK
MSNAFTLKLLFDGACPLCKREASMLQRKDKQGKLAFEDIAAPDFDPAKYGLDPVRVNARIHGVLSDGTVIEGMEVFRRAYALIGRGWLLAWTAWPVLRPIADLGYRLFAANRHRLTFRKNPCTADRCAPKF